MTSYKEIELIKNTWNGKFAIFGAGRFGTKTGYDFLSAAGIGICCFFDNNITPNTEIRNGICTKSIDYLYTNAESIYIFICVSKRFQNEVIKQFNKHNINHFSIIDSEKILHIVDSIDGANDDIKKQYALWYDSELFLKRLFKTVVGYDLDFNNPKTFNQKLQWLKLYNCNPNYSNLVDKYRFKQYVSERFGNEYIFETLGLWDKYDDIDFDKLPNRFVLKCTHDSGSVVLVENKNLIDHEKCKEFFDEKLSINYYWAGREWPYKNASRYIICEPYMCEPDKMIDYKFMCFNGVPKLVFTCTERFEKSGLKVTFFDMDWKRMDFERHYPKSKKNIQKPLNFNKMIEFASKVSENIPFVRVDFYEIEGKLYFGEMTFFPGGGMEEFTPIEWDYKLGEWIQLPERKICE